MTLSVSISWIFLVTLYSTDMASAPENYQNFVSHSIIGVVGDVRREMGGHHYAEVHFKMLTFTLIYALHD